MVGVSGNCVSVGAGVFVDWGTKTSLGAKVAAGTADWVKIALAVAVAFPDGVEDEIIPMTTQITITPKRINRIIFTAFDISFFDFFSGIVVGVFIVLLLIDELHLL